MSLFLRTIRRGWTSGSLRRGEVSAISPTRATTHVGRSTQTSTVSFTQNTSSWLPTWTTWKRTPSGTGDLLHHMCWGQGLSQGLFAWSFGSGGFSLQDCLLWKQREADQTENYSSEALKVGKTRQKSSHEALLQGAGRWRCVPQKRIKEREKRVLSSFLHNIKTFHGYGQEKSQAKICKVNSKL